MGRMNERPLFLTIISFLFIGTGAIGVLYHLADFWAQHPFQYGVLWISLVRLSAIVAGIYVLRGRNWARWLSLAWISFHVVLSVFHSWFQAAVHGLLCAAFAYFLFRPRASRYFHSRRASGKTAKA